jgi:hypothetical protein
MTSLESTSTEASSDRERGKPFPKWQRQPHGLGPFHELFLAFAGV